MFLLERTWTYSQFTAQGQYLEDATFSVWTLDFSSPVPTAPLASNWGGVGLSSNCHEIEYGVPTSIQNLFLVTGGGGVGDGALIFDQITVGGDPEVEVTSESHLQLRAFPPVFASSGTVPYLALAIPPPITLPGVDYVLAEIGQSVGRKADFPAAVGIGASYSSLPAGAVYNRGFMPSLTTGVAAGIQARVSQYFDQATKLPLKATGPIPVFAGAIGYAYYPLACTSRLTADALVRPGVLVPA
jgi:hypothetical protein